MNEVTVTEACKWSWYEATQCLAQQHEATTFSTICHDNYQYHDL